MNPGKFLRRLGRTVLVIFILMNVIAANQAWHFTHYSDPEGTKTKQPGALSFTDKLETVVMGVSNPRPINRHTPAEPYEQITIAGPRKLECWFIKALNPKGTVLLLHGYGGCKASMLDKSDAFLEMGYNTLLIDFRGSGGSEGTQTTIGYKEEEDVKAAWDYLQARGEKKIILFGTSMGAAAILHTLSDYPIQPAGICIECPFGTMYQTTCARFKLMKAPIFPMAGLLVFWGGLENGFWAFSLSPAEYAKSVHCPALLIYGGRDEKVSLAETQTIFANMQGKKSLKVYPLAAHDNYLTQYKVEWIQDQREFLNSLN